MNQDIATMLQGAGGSVEQFAAVWNDGDGWDCKKTQYRTSANRLVANIDPAWQPQLWKRTGGGWVEEGA